MRSRACGHYWEIVVRGIRSLTQRWCATSEATNKQKQTCHEGTPPDSPLSLQTQQRKNCHTHPAKRQNCKVGRSKTLAPLRGRGVDRRRDRKGSICRIQAIHQNHTWKNGTPDFG